MGIDINCTFEKGSRVLIAGANGAGKSTLLSIVGGKKMVPLGHCQVLGKECFNDTTLNAQRMYCGDWWRTNFFFNLSVTQLIGEDRLKSARVQELIDVLLQRPFHCQGCDVLWRLVEHPIFHEHHYRRSSRTGCDQGVEMPAPRRCSSGGYQLEDQQ